MRRFPVASTEQNLAFWRAVEANDARAVKRLIDGGLRPNAWVEDPEVDQGGTGLLHGAAGLAAVDVVRLLLRAGVPVDQRRESKKWSPTPLHVAAQNAGTWRGERAARGPLTVAALLKAGADPNAVWHVAAHDSACPLALAVEGHNDSSSLAVMRLLLEAGAAVNGRRGTRWPLGMAMERRRLALAVELMVRGADPKQWRRHGSAGERENGTPFVCAAVPTVDDDSGETAAVFWCALVRYAREPDHADLNELDTFLERAPEAVARRARSWRNSQRAATGVKPKA